MKKLFTFIIAIILTGISYSQTTIQQKLLIVQNDGTNGGNFRVAIQVKGTNLTAASTLGSATIDVVFDNTKLSYVNASGWAFGSSLGYTRAATNNTTFIRVGITGGSIGVDGPGDPAGFDITAEYITWVQLNFTIINTSVTTSFTIAGGSNAIGLFENHSNNPNTGVINNQTLSAPEVISDAPLPVELSSFTASITNNTVNLEWTTATEVNNYGFDIERKIQDADWQKIGFVEGNGNSNSPKEYSFIDENPPAGNLQYRLKQIDTDGQYEYYETIAEVNFNATATDVEGKNLPIDFNLSQNYPNPFNPATVINYELPATSLVQIKVYDILGNEIEELVNEIRAPGYYQIEFNGSKLSSGVYIYRLIAGSFVETRKMNLLK